VTTADKALELLCINTIRTLAIDAIQTANSGHPGMPLGAAPMGYVVWQRHLRHDPDEPAWPDRDRFVLSAGHGSMLLYALLHLTGYPVTRDDLLAFRQWGSVTPGHPEFGRPPGVEATTGPLGQGAANAVGMAIAERLLAHRFNRPGFPIVNHRTYAILSDGDVMEGVCAEAASLAGHLKLGKLICLYDSNCVSLDGPTHLTFSTEDVAARYGAYGWHVQRVADGNHDTQAIDEALGAAAADTSRPSLIIVHTTIGYGSPSKQGTSEAHGSPLGEEEVRRTKAALGWNPDLTLHVPAAAAEHFRAGAQRGKLAHVEWRARLEAFGAAYPELAEEWRRTMRGELPPDWDTDLPRFGPEDAQPTRQAGGKVLNAIARRVPELVGGDADLSVSTQTALSGAGSFDGQSGAGRNFHFGVREHAMAAIANGMAYHGSLRPYVATFFVFSDYMRPAVRLAALSRLPVLYVWTHDSIGVGEDGPTHQPVEHLMSLRAMPNLAIVRPADPTETVEAWRWAMQHRQGPVGLVFTRQKVPAIDRSRFASAAGLARGAYVLADATDGEPQAIIVATGSEVHLALAAWERLTSEGIRTRVVSMPCWEAFAQQSQDYRDMVLPPAVTARVSVEAGITLGWERWVGTAGIVMGLEGFGASAPAAVNMERFGLSADRVVEAVRSLLSRT
jgi:transketolase